MVHLLYGKQWQCWTVTLKKVETTSWRECIPLICISYNFIKSNYIFTLQKGEEATGLCSMIDWRKNKETNSITGKYKQRFPIQRNHSMCLRSVQTVLNNGSFLWRHQDHSVCLSHSLSLSLSLLTQIPLPSFWVEHSSLKFLGSESLSNGEKKLVWRLVDFSVSLLFVIFPIVYIFPS